MSFMNKVKNFFYEDVEDDEVETRVEEKKRFNPFKREPKVEEEPKVAVEEVKDVKQEANNDLSERELFKAERTFNFPMDLGDEIFDEDEPVVEETREVFAKPEPVKEQTYTRSIYHNISKEEPKREEKKRFKPTPVISPVYGILDKNYTVDDVVEADKTKEFSFDKKIVDFDSVRNRAYKDLDDELEKTMNTEVFYNLDEEEPETKEDVVITYDEVEEKVPTVAEEVEFKEVEIPEVEVSSIEEPEIPEIPEEDEDDDLAPDVKIEVPKRTRRSRSAKVEEYAETPEEKEEKEDLFNLIDNMYNEDDEEEE